MIFSCVGTITLLEALRAHGLGASRVLVAASSAQYGDGIGLLPRPEQPFPETTPQLPLSPYGVSKAAMELVGRQYWRNFGMPILFARLFPQVGLGQDGVWKRAQPCHRQPDLQLESRSLLRRRTGTQSAPVLLVCCS